MMLDNFIFSVNSVAPVFVVLVLGYIIKHKKLIDENTIKNMNNLVFSLALPLMLFRDISKSNFNDFFDPTLLIWAASTTFLIFILSWIFAEIFMKEKPSIGAFVQGSFRSNYAIIGLPLIANILGSQNTGKGALITTFVVPLYSIFSVIVLSFRNYENKQGSGAIKSAIISICKNPMVIAIFIAMPFSFFNIKQPVILSTSINYMGNLTTPLALLAIGGSMNLKAASQNMNWAIVAGLIKLIIAPLIFIPLSVILFKMRGEDLVVLYIMYSSPTAISSYVMATKMKSDEKLAANIILITTLFSVFTFTIGIYTLKTLGLI